MMVEYELISKILSPQYKVTNQNVMVESGQQIVKINNKGTGLKAYTLYRFDLNSDTSLFSFFNCSDEAPVNLRAFCDYIMLAETSDRLFVLLIELKSGASGHAYKQLNASELFVNYIKETAERIKDDNDYSDFSASNLIVRKIVVKPMKFLKPTTKVSNNSKLDFIYDQDHYNYKTNIFDIPHVCRMQS